MMEQWCTKYANIHVEYIRCLITVKWRKKVQQIFKITFDRLRGIINCGFV